MISQQFHSHCRSPIRGPILKGSLPKATSLLIRIIEVAFSPHPLSQAFPAQEYKGQTSPTHYVHIGEGFPKKGTSVLQVYLAYLTLRSVLYVYFCNHNYMNNIKHRQ